MHLSVAAMNVAALCAYILIIGGVAVWGLLPAGCRKFSPATVQHISVFGGAFLLASCFINLVPHIFVGAEGQQFITGPLHFKIAASVLIGFVIQLLIEHTTRGIEHGHNHCECCHETHDDHAHHHHEGHCHAEHHHPVWGLMIGLSLHAFMEGMPLVGHDGDLHQGLLYGIVLHNIPIALVMVGLFIENGFSVRKITMLLLLFGIMSPLGSLCNLFLLPPDPVLQKIVMGVVVGILLHVSASILFDHEHNAFSWSKMLLILLAFAAAYFTPGCPEIYPL